MSETSTMGPIRGQRIALDRIGPIGLGGAAALHVAWAFGRRWRGGSDRAWAELIGGTTKLPTAAETSDVTALLSVAAVFRPLRARTVLR